MSNHIVDANKMVLTPADVERLLSEARDGLGATDKQTIALCDALQQAWQDHAACHDALDAEREWNKQQAERIVGYEADLSTLRATLAERESEIQRLKEALNTLPSKITIEPWEDREMIVCYCGDPVGMTITERDGRGITEFFHRRGVWGDIAGRIIRRAAHNIGKEIEP